MLREWFRNRSRRFGALLIGPGRSLGTLAVLHLLATVSTASPPDSPDNFKTWGLLGGRSATLNRPDVEFALAQEFLDAFDQRIVEHKSVSRDCDGRTPRPNLTSLDRNHDDILHLRSMFGRELIVYCVEYPLFAASDGTTTRAFECNDAGAFDLSLLELARDPSDFGPLRDAAGQPVAFYSPDVDVTVRVTYLQQCEVVNVLPRRFVLRHQGSGRQLSIPRSPYLRSIDNVSWLDRTTFLRRTLNNRERCSGRALFERFLRRRSRVLLMGEHHCLDGPCPHGQFLADQVDLLEEHGYAIGLELPATERMAVLEEEPLGKAFPGRKEVTFGEVFTRLNAGELPDDARDEFLYRCPLQHLCSFLRNACEQGIELVPIDNWELTGEAEEEGGTRPTRDAWMAKTVLDYVRSRPDARLAIIVGAFHTFDADVTIRANPHEAVGYPEDRNLIRRLHAEPGLSLTTIYLHDFWTDRSPMFGEHLDWSHSTTPSYDRFASDRARELWEDFELFTGVGVPEADGSPLHLVDGMIMILPGSEYGTLREAVFGLSRGWDATFLEHPSEGIQTFKNDRDEIALQYRFRSGERVEIRTAPPWW